MPQTLDRVIALVNRLEHEALLPATLLVVPGLNWNEQDISKLQTLVTRGCELAGHGWTHKAPYIRGIYHRLHSWTISGPVAEHLSLTSAEEESDLILRCINWFAANDLPSPSLYVPPAWALGFPRKLSMSSLPIAAIETLTGLWQCRNGNFQHLPMLGFEAKTSINAIGCRIWNAFNLWQASTPSPLRIAIHPFDTELRLSKSLDSVLSSGGTAISYQRFFDSNTTALRLY